MRLDDDDLDFEVVEPDERPRSHREHPARRKVREEGLAIDQPEREWAYLDRLAAQEDINRFVDRAQHGDLTHPGPLHESGLRTEAEEEIGRAWDMEKISHRLAELSGAASSVAKPGPSPPPSSSTTPTDRPAATHQPASENGASSTRREAMTMDRQGYRHNDRIPPKTNDEVAAIMAETGLGRRAAYDVVRKRKADQIDINGIGQGQRTAVMAILISKPDAGKNTDTLIAAMHDAGIKIDGHDVQKTLWALDKAGHVTFRARTLGGRKTVVWAIKPTPAGLSAYDFERSLSLEGLEGPTIFESAPPALVTITEVVDDTPEPEETEVVVHVLENAKALQEELDKMGAGRQPLYRARPWAGDMEDWPAFRSVRERARKADKINQAAKLLEEAGEEDIALTLMGRTDFNPLEEEVIRLLHVMGELE